MDNSASIDPRGSVPLRRVEHPSRSILNEVLIARPGQREVLALTGLAAAAWLGLERPLDRAGLRDAITAEFGDVDAVVDDTELDAAIDLLREEGLIG